MTTQNPKKMNKKGRLGDIIPWVIMGTLLIYIIISIIMIIKLDVKGEACRSLGFEDDVYWNDQSSCEDGDGNIYFVKMDCDYKFFPTLGEKNCIAKRIKVGEVWGTGYGTKD